VKVQLQLFGHRSGAHLTLALLIQSLQQQFVAVAARQVQRAAGPIDGVGLERVDLVDHDHVRPA
jgi:hypothetical protein